MRRASFRSLLRAWIFGYAFLSVALSAAFFVGYANNEVNRHLRLAEDMIQLYADDTVSIEFGRHNAVYVEDALQRLVRLLDAKKGRILGPDGTIIESTDASEIGNKATISPAESLLSAIVREHSSGERLATLEVHVSKSALMTGALRTALVPAMLLLMGLVVLSGVVVRSLRKRLLRPISKLLSSTDVPDAEVQQWPSEIADLSERLHQVIQDRDFAMIGQFSSGILHDIKTRIHSINSAKEMIDELPVESSKRESRLEGLYRACSVHLPKIRGIVEATLDGTRSIAIQPTGLDVKATVTGVLNEFQAYAEKRGVQIEAEFAAEEFTAVHDKVQLERAVSNLLKNGIEAFDNTSATEKKVIVSARLGSGGVEIDVEDNGPGLTVPPNILLKSIRTSKTHGSGLGLLVARKIIEGHHGQLVAGTSDRLKGARFTLTLPGAGGAA